MNERIIFTTNSMYGDYKRGEKGTVLGWMQGGDGVPCAVVKRNDGRYVMSPLNHIVSEQHFDTTKTK